MNSIVKTGHAMRVIFFYPNEEGTYVDNAEVTVYTSGIVHIKSKTEETTTQLNNCEILWWFNIENDDSRNKITLLNRNV